MDDYFFSFFSLRFTDFEIAVFLLESSELFPELPVVDLLLIGIDFLFLCKQIQAKSRQPGGLLVGLLFIIDFQLLPEVSVELLLIVVIFAPEITHVVELGLLGVLLLPLVCLRWHI